MKTNTVHINDFSHRKNKEEIEAVKLMISHPLSYLECIKQRDENRIRIAENFQQLSKVKKSFEKKLQ